MCVGQAETQYSIGMALHLTSISVVFLVRDRETRKSLEGLESLDHQEIKIMPQSLQQIKVTEQSG